MVVCKYYQQGHCRFGERCHNQHPGAGRPGDGPAANRYGAFGGGGPASVPDPSRLTTSFGIAKLSDIRDDFTAGKGRPQWILSTYGPSKSVPASLLDGNELSFEELRLRFYELASKGNQNQANEEANTLWAKAERDMQDAINNLDNLIKFEEEAEKKHPNRFDLCKMDGKKSVDQVKQEARNQVQPAGAFRNPGFGQPSNLFSKPPPSSGFGQPSTGFGQPSALGGGSAFGQPAQAGRFGQPAFGQPSNPSQASPFGKPSQSQQSSGFGQPVQPSAFGKPAFGQPSQPAFGTAGFGQPSQPGNPFASSAATNTPTPAFGTPSAPTSGFGQSSAPNSGFGQPSAPTAGFGTPTFGQPATQPASMFRKPSAAPGFGQTAFGQPQQTQATNQPSKPFTQPQQQSNPFAASSSTATFGVPSTSATSSSTTGMFGAKSTVTANQPAPVSTPRPPNFTGTSSNPHPLTQAPLPHLLYTQTLPTAPSQSITKTDPATKRPRTILTAYRSCPVTYNKEDKPCYQRPDGKGLERIFFPEGGEPGVKAEEVEIEGPKYTDEVVEEWKRFFERGMKFQAEGGLLSIPPKLAWGVFDF